MKVSERTSIEVCNSACEKKHGVCFYLAIFKFSTRENCEA